MPTTVEVLAQAFEEMGTPFIVGHPGGESVELMQAARERGMRFILMKQETAGAMLAATWGEITGSPGVCLSTRGPGAANMVNGVAHAWMDRCPLITITDQYSAPTYEIGLRQRLDQRALYAPVTKWSTSINAKTVRQQLRRAVRTACALPPGPVQFDMPQSETTREAGEATSEGPLLPQIVPMIPDRDALKEPLAVLAKARKPILLVGLGVYWSRASAELVALAERLGAPVLTTSKCKGAIPEDHPLRAGCIIGGLIERKLILESDLIVTVGLDAIELQPKPWPYSLPVMSLAGTPNLDAVVPAAPEVVGDLKSILAGLAQWAPEGSGWGEKAARTFREEVVAALDTPATGLSPQRAMEVARAVLPRDTIATCDAGASRLLVVQKWQSYGPREFLTSNGLGSMGFAIPGALAARLAHPDRPVVAFTGDGGFMMAVAELQTSVREALPIIVVVLDDEEIGLIRVKQEIKGLPTYGVKMGGMDWEKLAQGFGADGVVVDTEHALGDALQAALKTGRTTVIAARIDASGYVAQFNALREL
ncbi:acetolactate synthase-1/2/3 large subunit [Stella humosa]|uniref:Acetolactate synthase-1/2/3 large subunit n=1 Tax=Stella humosa TaxID=94 RepID=A0A3N1KTZ0_9PROT|nr:thiamine pyrophosphate-binding protein [Stella humosa]ROP80825.1 acetolactate synthase-1/2/3 large subunit [Stella humosa]BBK33384.1 acetolactate synthase [Stella humosa]